MTADAPPPARPPGRRGNGLQAPEWGALVDLDPRLSEALLDRLRAAQVAAFVEPATAADPSLRGSARPDRPLDRLWVDPSRAEAARTVLAAELAELAGPQGGDAGLVRAVPRGAAGRVLPPPRLPSARPSPAEDDAAFAAIVAGWDDDGGQPVPRWPVSEDLGPPAPAPPVAPPAPARAPGPGLPGWVEPAALEDDGHFVPPPPPPVPRLRPRTVLAVVAIVLGLVVLFAPGRLGLVSDGSSTLLGALMLGGGAGALVAWLRESSGPDDGAVV